MFRTTLKNLAARKLRLVTTSVAVMLGVAFMAGTLVLTDTIGRTFDDLFAEVNTNTDAYVRGVSKLEAGSDVRRPRLDAGVVDAVAAVKGVAVAEGSVEGYAQIADKEGKAVGSPNGAPTFGANWIVNDDLNPFDLAVGRAPQSDREVVIDKASADVAHLAVGDTTTVVTQAGPQQVEIVGIATFGGADGSGGASFAMFTFDAAQRFLAEPHRIDTVKVVAEPGVSQRELVDDIERVVPDGTEVLTGAEITAEEQSSVKEGMSFFSTFMLAFAVIALFVGAFIISNTFSILVAQRSKETALMRALGASRRQVLGAVLGEALAVGIIASAAGVAAGVGVAGMLKALLAAMGIDVPAGGVVLTVDTVVVSTLVGVGVSVASSLFPARRAANVPPIAAMRDVSIDKSASSRPRLVAGAGVAVSGIAALVLGFSSGALAVISVGAALVFVGVTILGPLMAGPLSRVIGAPLPRLRGMPGRWPGRTPCAAPDGPRRPPPP